MLTSVACARAKAAKVARTPAVMRSILNVFSEGGGVRVPACRTCVVGCTGPRYPSACSACNRTVVVTTKYTDMHARAGARAEDIRPCCSDLTATLSFYNMDVDGSAVEVPQAGMEGVEGASAVESAAAAGPGSSGAGAGAGAGDMHVEEDAPAQEQEGDEDEDGEDSGGEGKEPKHRWAVFFGYVGARFQGLQK